MFEESKRYYGQKRVLMSIIENLEVFVTIYPNLGDVCIIFLSKNDCFISFNNAFNKVELE